MKRNRPKRRPGDTTPPKAKESRDDAHSPDARSKAAISRPVVPVGKGEMAVLLLICLVGLSARFACPEGMAVEHFDEGVYASNIWFGPESGHQYPLRYLYAPPLLPGLIEAFSTCDTLWGISEKPPSDLTVMIPSLVAGCLMIPLVWWVVRCWFGVRAGIAASLLLATSDFHALYCRTALTDVLLVFLLLVAVWSIERAIVTGRVTTAIFAGVVSGLAWWTKYNGWLALFISLAGILFLALIELRQWRPIRQQVQRWLIVAAVTIVVWLPVLWSLQETGGYAAVAANHGKYVVGFGGWWSSFLLQFGNLRHLDGWLNSVGIAVAALMMATLRPEKEGTESRLPLGFALPRLLPLTLALLLGTWAFRLGNIVVLAILSVWGLMRHFLAGRNRTKSAGGNRTLAFWILVAWFASLFVATPLYHPYPRLTLTWLCAVWMAAGIGLDDLMGTLNACLANERFPFHTVRWQVGIAVVALTSCLAGLFLCQPLCGVCSPAWQSRAGLRAIAVPIASQARELACAAGRDPNEVLVCVYGEPALFFHCRREGLPWVTPVAHPSIAVEGHMELDCPALLVTGPHAHESPEFAEQWEEWERAFRPINQYPYSPSDFVLLNRYSPEVLAGGEQKIQGEVRVYAVK